MIFLDQLLGKCLVQGPNLTSYEFLTKWKRSTFCLTAQIAPEQVHSAGVTGHSSLFLDASSHLYKSACPSVGPSVRRSVGNAL